MGLPLLEIDRLFNYWLVRPNGVRETLLSYGAEIKLWFAERKLSGRATGRRKEWAVDLGWTHGSAL
jgi:hypothetical protein